MTTISVCHRSTGWLVLWLEPLGEDRWLKPGETFRVKSDYTGETSAFTVEPWSRPDGRASGIENLNVWVDEGDCFAVVVDQEGTVIECGHQRPEDVDRRWKSELDELRGRDAKQ